MYPEAVRTTIRRKDKIKEDDEEIQRIKFKKIK